MSQLYSVAERLSESIKIVPFRWFRTWISLGHIFFTKLHTYSTVTAAGQIRSFVPLGPYPTPYDKRNEMKTYSATYSMSQQQLIEKVAIVKVTDMRHQWRENFKLAEKRLHKAVGSHYLHSTNKETFIFPFVVTFLKFD